MMGDGGMMMGWMWLAGLFWVLLIAGGIALGVWAIARRSGSGNEANSRQDDRALAILRERFAQGEITESEYQAQRQVLEEG